MELQELAAISGLNCKQQMHLLLFEQSEAESSKFNSDAKQTLLIKKLVFTRFTMRAEAQAAETSFLLLL